MRLDPAAATRAIARGRVIYLLGLIGVAALYWLALAGSPADRIQGMVFKTVYLHVPAAVWMELSFLITGVLSVLVLWLKDPRLDCFAEASAEAGLLFGSVVLLTGPIWGRVIWGAWWVWEPRLTFTLLLYLLFVGYFSLRGTLQDPQERARFAAVVGIMALFLVPFIHLAVDLFASQHPEHVLLRTPTTDPNAPRFDPAVTRTILTGMGVFALLYLGAALSRYGVAIRKAALETGEDDD